MTDKKLERPLFVDLDFGAALARFIKTKPEEVEPAPGRKPKTEHSKPKGAGGSK
jgi:hypothetical protein